MEQQVWSIQLARQSTLRPRVAEARAGDGCQRLLVPRSCFQRRTPDGLRLTPQGARQIGAKALRDIFHTGRRGGRGHHTATRHGRPGPLTGETKAYEFGDAFDVHLERTLLHALLRHPRLPLNLHPQDFEVYRREPLTHSATVIMLDMSSCRVKSPADILPQ